MNKPPFGFATHESHYDPRTLLHPSPATTATPLITGGYTYNPEDIENQHVVGICTGISDTQESEKSLAKKYSPDFHYLLQKKFYDLDWLEGSSIFNSLRVAKNYGFLPIALFTYVTEADRYLPYSEYVAKLQAIPDSEITRLIGLCENKLAGYAQVSLDPQSLAQAIQDSKAGILCRFEVGQEWWTSVDGRVSYDPKDIDPLRAPAQVISGHAITMSAFDFTQAQMFTLANTWGTTWNNQGIGHINFAKYKPTEAWIPYFNSVPTPAPKPFIFTQDMYLGQTTQDIKQLQIRLGMTVQTGYYGSLTRAAVLQYQISNNVQLSWWERYIMRGSTCGAKTRAALNSQ